MKTFVLAPDSYKESLTAKEVCDAMEKGICKVYPDSKFIKVPMADGGEGTVQSLVDATKGVLKKVSVLGPKDEYVNARYGLLGDGTTAVIEMSEASGINLINKEERNPLLTHTYGTGQLIVHCIESGIKKIIIGIGGSATNDGGMGMAMALGVKFYNKDNKLLPLGGGYLDRLHRIDISEINPLLKNVEVIVACDVTNPLTGENGATVVYGPQKGATPEIVKRLELNLVHYANIIETQIGKSFKNEPGSGAAGGLGGGLLVFTNAKLEKGIDIVIKHTGLEDKIMKSDFVFTGEGKTDEQTLHGKTPYGVAKVALRYNKPIFAISGQLGSNLEKLYEVGFTGIFCILPKITMLDDAIANSKKNITNTCYNVAKILACKC